MPTLGPGVGRLASAVAQEGTGFTVARQTRPSMRPLRRIRRFIRQRAYVTDGALFVRVPVRASHYDSMGLTPPHGAKKRHALRFYATPLTALVSMLGGSPAVDTLVIREPYGRMGNQTMQLVHAHALATRWNLTQIVAPKNSTVPQGCSAPGSASVDTDPRAVRRPRLGDFLTGVLAPRRPAHLTGNPYHLPQLQSALSREEVSEAFRAVRECADLASTDRPLGKNHLVIHVRGGDAFGEHAHREYAQPPVAFYLLAISAKKWQRATIVRADDSYPFEPVLSRALEAAGIDWDIHSASPDEDARFLARARYLVSSRGSFVPAIVGRSRHTETLWIFGPETTVRQGVTTHRVLDTGGEYWNTCCQSNWTDSPAQRELMAHYPLDKLTETVEKDD